MLYRNLSVDGQIKQLLSDISVKIPNSEKKDFLKSLGVVAVEDLYKLDDLEKSKVVERLFQERARRFTARDVSFSLK